MDDLYTKIGESLADPPDGGADSSTDRRSFLKVIGLGSAGFAVAVAYWPTAHATEAERPMLNAFVRIASDDSVTVMIKHLDKGQGVTTGLTTIVAEELDADWAQMRWAFAPANAKLYNNLAWGPVQGTGGSSSVRNSWMQLRRAGAAARAMLVAAAAREWDVPANAIDVVDGELRHRSGRKGSFGQFAAAAASEKPPADPSLKDPAEFRLIGQHVPRIDSSEKSSGRARYTIDVVRPGMLTAVVEHPPQFGARVSRFDAAAARSVAGVREVVEIPTGVAVVADSYWAATQGRAALVVEWNFDLAEQRGSAQLVDEFRDLLLEPGAVARDDGDVEAALEGAHKVVEASFEFPYLAHAAMEPLNAVVEIKPGGCEIWTGSQSPTNDQRVAAAILGIEPGAVKINTQFAGGSFGRRSVPDSDYVAEAVAVAKAIGGRAPVKLQWSREDDMRAGRYRPMTLHALRAGLDANGNIIGWSHRIVGQSFLRGTSMEGMIVNGVDRTIVEGAYNLPYTVPNFRCDLHLVDVGVPTLWWRSVGHSHNGYATEAFFDEVAAAAGKDPITLRRQLLRDHPRHRRVLDLAVAKAGPAPTGKGRGRGVAVHAAFRSFVAQVVDVTLSEDGSYSIDDVVCAVDCGIAINPDIVRAQMEGSIGFGLGAVMQEAVVFEAGVVRSTNFDSYRPLRIPEMPPVAVHIVASAEPPTGVGEPGLPPVGPALANALRAVTGKTVHRLPIGARIAV